MEDATRPALEWRTIAEAVPGGVAVQRGERFVHVTETAADLLGVSADALRGESWRTLVVPAERDRLGDAIATARDGREWQGRVTVGPPSDDAETVDVTLAAPDGDAVVWTVAEAPADRRRPLDEREDFLDNVVDALEDVLYVVDEDANFVYWNDVAVERTGYTDAEFADLHPMAFAVEGDVDEADREAFDVTDLPDRYTLDLVTKSGETVPHDLHGVTYRDEATGEVYLVGLARDVSDRLERERELERQRDELATLDRINELILTTVQELLRTANRDAVERAVCDRLAGSALYQFAWVGEPELDGDRIVPRVIAGDDAGYLDGVTITDVDGASDAGPVGRALATGEVQAANVSDPDFALWSERARERGVESVLAVPLHHGETVYGVLAVYAPRTDAFSERERAAFDVLGRTVGFVFHAERSRELLFADEVVELEFSLPSSESLFGQAAPTLDCDIELAGYVATDDEWVLYVIASGVEPAAVIDYARADPVVSRIRAIDETADGGRLEVAVEHSALFETVAAAGATVRTAAASPEGARLVVEAPIGADVRDVVEIVTREYDGAELVARRERERAATTPAPPEGLLDGLTDRQRSALRAAYRAGYFEWPRESTAEEVAATLDVAPATLHGHLRKAEKSVFDALFDAE